LQTLEPSCCNGARAAKHYLRSPALGTANGAA